jgi:HEAT repeat protein
MNRGWFRSVLLAAAAVAIGAAPCAARGQTASGTAASAGAERSVQQDIQQQAAILADASATQSQRDEAANRLASRLTGESRQMLLNVLADFANPRGQLAVARALAGESAPEPAFIDPLFALLGTDRALTEAAAQAIANYRSSPGAFTRLVNFANSRQQRAALRTATIRALGTLDEKRAAAALMEMMVRPDEDSEIRNAAADALIQMTGLRENGRDLQRWQEWWAANQNKDDTQFRSEQLAQRAARFSQLQFRYSHLAEELDSILNERYRAAAAAQQPDILMRYLSSSEPEIRAIGARLVAEDAVAGTRPVPATVKQRLRDMIGDSSTDVRIEVVRSLRFINDAAALQALLTQLGQEPSADIRSAIAQALAQIGDLRAAPELLRLLDDPSLRVAESAARALYDLGPALRESDGKFAHQLALRLQTVLEQRTAAADAQSSGLREAAVLALAPLRDPAVGETLLRLLRPGESVGVRRGAIKGLGELRDARAADSVAACLDDPAGAIRLEAVDALNKLGSVEHVDALLERTGTAETDTSIRDRAWQVVESFLPKLNKDKLASLAERFREEPTRRLLVLKNLAAMQVRDKDLAQLAYTQQNIGETLMQLDHPADAEIYLRQALDYWQAQKVENMVTEQLIDRRTDALLRSKQYAEVARFGETLIARQTAYQQTIGSRIRAETERLVKDKDYADAAALIAEARKMNPRLAAQYLEVLDDLETQINRSRNATTTNPQAETPMVDFPHLLGTIPS